MFNDPLFAKYSSKVSKIRKLINITMMVRVMDFKLYYLKQLI